MLVLCFIANIATAQRTVIGVVVDSLSNPVAGATVYIEGTGAGTSTDSHGRFRLNVSNVPDTYIKVSCVGYSSAVISIAEHLTGADKPLRVVLREDMQLIDEVLVRANQRRVGNIERLNVRDISYMPNVSGSFEALLKTLPGVSSSNEMSSQYSVRGGNFDENLVYVNGIEIFRPFLVRSGQQEGLSFVNPDMVSAVDFSAGAFNAEYGDKMSSVLDVHYRKPTKFATSASVSLLGASATTEGVAQNGKFSYLMGLRYKTTTYMLGTLDTDGEYSPTFIDWQGVFNYSISPKLSCSLLGNYSSNAYLFAPKMRETRWGPFNNSLQLKVYYEGMEADRFQSAMGALTFTYSPVPKLNLDIYSASYMMQESETFDLLGQYFLNELDSQIGSTTYTDSIINVGVGGFLNHARNFLHARMNVVGTRGSWNFGYNVLKWGASYQRDQIEDRISEWDLIDSSGYAMPHNTTSVELSNVLKARNNIAVSRVAGFVQLNGNFEMGGVDVATSAGARLLWWGYSREVMFSPRASLTVTPHANRNLQLHLSAGVYYQPPFYREFRLPSGALNDGIKSQKSTQLLAGANYYFRAWERPFRFSMEAYYKWLSNLIPYKLDNVRVKYAGENLATGYAKGIDVKLNGEMVSGAESWVGLSVMKTEEDIKNDSYVNAQGQVISPGYYRRPTDQRFTFSLFFQDYLPGNQKIKAHLTGFYGSGLPCNVTGSTRYDLIFKMPAFRRVDIGFTASVYSNIAERSLIGRRLRGIMAIDFGAEIFNLFNFNNTVSYLWVHTVGNQENQAGQYAVPNYLTLRRINVKLAVRF